MEVALLKDGQDAGTIHDRAANVIYDEFTDKKPNNIDFEDDDYNCSDFERVLKKIVKSVVIKKLSAPNWQVIADAFRFSISLLIPGQQILLASHSPFIDLDCFSYDDINQIFTQLPPVSNINTQELYITQCLFNMMISNQKATNVALDIYECIAKKDVPLVEGTVVNIIQQGVGDEFHVTPQLPLGPGETPFMIQKLTNYFDIIKVTRAELSAGQTYTFFRKFDKTFKFTPQSIISVTYLKDSGYTVILVASGEPDNDATTKTEVASGVPVLDVTVTKQYYYSYVVSQSTATTITNNEAGSIAESQIFPMLDTKGTPTSG
jgi:hypothetical protein